MTNKTKTGFGSTIATVAIMLALGFVFSEFLKNNKDIGISNPKRKIITLASIWMPAREMSIHYWIDNVKNNPPIKLDDKNAFWSKEFEGHVGQTYKLKVEQHGLGGYLQCEITQDGATADIDQLIGAGECVVEHRVY